MTKTEERLKVFKAEINRQLAAIIASENQKNSCSNCSYDACVTRWEICPVYMRKQK